MMARMIGQALSEFRPVQRVLEVSMISRKLCIAILVFGAFLIPQRAFPAEKWPDPVDEYVAQLRKTIGTVDMDGFLQVVKNPNGIRLIDVREPSEFDTGHVPGAVNAERKGPQSGVFSHLGRCRGFPRHHVFSRFAV